MIKALLFILGFILLAVTIGLIIYFGRKYYVESENYEDPKKALDKAYENEKDHITSKYGWNYERDDDCTKALAKLDEKYQAELKKLESMPNNTSKTGGLAGAIIAAIAMLAFVIAIPGSFHQVEAGEIAVVKEVGKIVDVHTEGTYFDFYMTKKYEIYDTKIRQISLDTQAYTFDKQTVDLKFALQYQIDKSSIIDLATTYGKIEQIEDKIQNVALDKIKTVFAQKTADQIIEKRNDALIEAKTAVNTAINSNTYYLTVKDLVLTNIDFTDDYEAAVAAKVAQEQKKQQADIENAAAIAKAEAEAEAAQKKAEGEAEVARIQAEAAAEVARIQAEAAAEVAKIEADAAEYQGKKDAAIMMNKLAGVNGWYVTNVYGDDGVTVIGYRLMKGDGTFVNDEELAAGVEKLIQVLYAEKWDGKLPVYMMDSNGVVTVLPNA